MSSSHPLSLAANQTEKDNGNRQYNAFSTNNSSHFPNNSTNSSITTINHEDSYVGKKSQDHQHMVLKPFEEAGKYLFKFVSPINFPLCWCI